MLSNSNWYVLRCNPRCEEKARTSLRRAGFGTYLPKMRIERQHRRTKKWNARELLLMPRYIFVEMPVIEDDARPAIAASVDWFALRRCDGVEGFLGVVNDDGALSPFPIPSKTVERLIAMQADMQFDDTRAAKLRRREIGKNERETTKMRFPVGSRVRAKEGPFAAFGGLVTNITAKGEVEAMIAIFGRLTPATFPVEHLEPVDRIFEAA